MVNQKGVCTCNPPVKVRTHKVFYVNFFKNMKIGQGEYAIYTDNVSAVNIGKSPYLVHVLLPKGDYEGGIGYEVE